MRLLKSLIAFVQTVFSAWRGPFLDETAGLGKDMISIAQGKSQKEIDLEKEIKNQKRILKAQQLAQEQIDFEN